MVGHPVAVRGLALPGSGAGPTIVARTEQDFIAAVLDELESPNRSAELAETLASKPAGSNLLKLFQPVQRTFNVALLEVCCEVFGQPRLDPERIESAGLVVRRLAVDDDGRLLHPPRYEGWRQGPPLDGGRAPRLRPERAGPQPGASLRGWVRFDDPRQADLDPDPAYRRTPGAGHAEVDRRLARLHRPAETLSESSVDLFVASPEICEAAGKTILYGLVPVTSTEVSEAPETVAYRPQDIQALLPTYLKASTRTKEVPRAGRTLGVTALDGLNPALRDDRLLRDYAEMLRLLKFVFDAFGDSSRGRALFQALNQIRLPFDPLPSPLTLDYPAGFDPGAATPQQRSLVERFTRPAGDELRRATAVLVDRTPGQSVQMPSRWPSIGASQAAAIASAVKNGLDARLAEVGPRQPRFGDPARRYQARAFVRVIHSEACPPETIWSEYGEPFTIAPWYESGALPPIEIALPNVTDPNVLRNLKPNVAFSMPENVFNFLNGLGKDALTGSLPGLGGGGLAIGWICSFSIPIITFCAFLVLNIFLTLFDIVFFWLLFIKICLPFPRRSS